MSAAAPRRSAGGAAGLRARRTRRPALRVVDAAAARRERWLRRAIVAFAALSVVSVFVVVALHAMITQGQFELDRLRDDTADAQRDYQELRLEVAGLVTPEQVVTRATELGLVAADQVQYLSVPDAGPATTAPGTDPTSSTLAEGWPEVKPHLAAQP